MLMRLARGTRAYHAAADTDRLALMDVSSVPEYRARLARIFGFEFAIERAVAAVLAPYHVGCRAKLARLRDDLVALGMTREDIGTIPVCAVNPVRAPAHAFGLLFVIERNTLVAGLIARYLASQMPAVERTASGYLNESSRNAGARLRALGDVLGSYIRHESGAPHAVIAAARSAFRLQRRWYMRATHRPGLARSTVLGVEPRDAA
jgi:heme oxygenase